MKLLDINEDLVKAVNSINSACKPGSACLLDQIDNDNKQPVKAVCDSK